MACALGRPSHAFGTQFERFDGEIKNSKRLACTPYHFISRVIWATNGSSGENAIAEVEYDIPPDAWYFAESGSTGMPVSVMVEVLLQPCGWLASFAGTWLDVRQDIFFRNLDGSGVFHRQVVPSSSLLRTIVTLASCSRAGRPRHHGIPNCVSCRRSARVRGEGSFRPLSGGGTPKSDCAVAHDQHELAWMSAPANASLALQDWSGIPRIGHGRLRMIDRVTGFWPDGVTRETRRGASRKRYRSRRVVFQSPFHDGSGATGLTRYRSRDRNIAGAISCSPAVIKECAIHILNRSEWAFLWAGRSADKFCRRTAA